MYRAQDIIDSWKGLHAWRQEHDPNGEQLESDLTTGESGMYYQDEHPMLTLQNLKSIMPDFSLVTYPAYEALTNYPAGAIVTSGGLTYEAKRANVGADPATSPDDWREHKPLNSWLRQKTEAAILDTILSFLEEKEMNRTAKTLLENKTLFDGIGKLDNTIAKTGKKAGFEIITARAKGITARIDRLGLQFDTIGAIDIYLHHSSQESALKTISCDYNKVNSVQWFDIGWDLPNVSNDVDSGGAYYLTYSQVQAPGQAIQKEKEWNADPCYGCQTKEEARTWNIYSRYMEINPFMVPDPGNLLLWDIDNNLYDNHTNHGLNLAISLYCDYTSFFVEQRDLFKSALRKQMAMNLLRELAYNPSSRINQSESTVKRDQLLYEIDGDTRGRNTGIGLKYRKALEAIKLNVQGLNRVCLDCKKNGINYGSVTRR